MILVVQSTDYTYDGSCGFYWPIWRARMDKLRAVVLCCCASAHHRHITINQLCSVRRHLPGHGCYHKFSWWWGCAADQLDLFRILTSYLSWLGSPKSVMTVITCSYWILSLSSTQMDSSWLYAFVNLIKKMSFTLLLRLQLHVALDSTAVASQFLHLCLYFMLWTTHFLCFLLCYLWESFSAKYWMMKPK